jgi:hypothetical protein
MDQDQTLWLVGQYKGESDIGRVGEFQGVFSTQQKAEAACRDRNYWVMPLTLDKEYPHESEAAVGAYYPLAKKEEAKDG